MIVYSCTDLIFATKIRATAEALGIGSRPTRNADALRHRLDQIDDGKLNEPVEGVLIDLELKEEALGLIDQVKNHQASIPVVAFGSHVQMNVLESARQRGADFVMARSVFTATLPDILRRLNSPQA